MSNLNNNRIRQKNCHMEIKKKKEKSNECECFRLNYIHRKTNLHGSYLSTKNIQWETNYAITEITIFTKLFTTSIANNSTNTFITES